ncbi:chemotaxis protein CheW [Devosia sp. J2-20]|jgi:purine-binding chemotaxis protein CheW|uniref:Purine-binding chemotaxis protein CheW n=1 Tax=Devosia litorisediminis TaxID=2829817 RepID=A0A942E7T1_9HYPH|nr:MULTISPECIES: chemotaxis protein CheW [Devosia]MBS3849635.1 purine-binding chemotaxis protein CheW [Devosia litorisediminis]MCZ4347917.1 chemotaxis protein CheW [Devosia neptuniae]WDR00395.1 chemotaxis protein CheW [Devosia sp. J2-20]
MSTAMEFEVAEGGQDSVLAGPANQFVTFSAGDKGYGVDIMAVREIRSWSPTTELPDGSYSACGVLDIRGTVVEVHDLSAMLGGQRLQPEPGHVVLVVSLGETNVGILVDSVSDIIFAKDDEFRAAPNSGGDPDSAKVSRLVRQEDRLIAILNLQALFPYASMH